MAEIGIPILILLIVYVIYIFTKTYPAREKKIFISYTRTGSQSIPGELSTQGDRAYPRNILNYDIPRRDDDFGPLVIEMGIDSLKCILG